MVTPRSTLPGRRKRPRSVLLVAALAALTLAAFLPLSRNGFVGFDDPDYLTDNPAVRHGLSARGLLWSLTAVGYAGNWHPLTWWSHMLDVELFSLDPRGHHLSSLLLHLLAATLLFTLLDAAGAGLWPSWFTAALFAVHPLHVESVAWASERKDVLSGVFWMITIGAYLHYLRRPSRGRHLLTAASLALGLMAKPMLLTLPFVLLLLDVWPLGRLGGGAARSAGLRSLLVEKMPLLALSSLSAVVTLVAQGRGGLIDPMGPRPLGVRVSNAVISLAAYMGRTVWPDDLAVFYPYSSSAPPGWKVASAALLLAGITAAALHLRRRHPYLGVGWGWFLITLTPVLGLVQVGMQARADRYTYLPLIGLFMAVSTAAAGLGGRRRVASGVLAGSLTILMLLAALTRIQAATWRDDASLFAHAVEAVPGNWWGYYNLGMTRLNEGRPKEAEALLGKALEAKPDYYKAHVALGVLLARRGDYALALPHHARALELNPEDAESANNLGVALMMSGRPEEALAAFDRALGLKPDYASAHYNVGLVLEGFGLDERAREHFRFARQIDPSLPMHPPER